MPRSRINKSKYYLNKNTVSKRKKSMLRGGEIIRYLDGAIYDGEVKDGKKHGRGKYNFSNGDSYEGNFVNGDFEGHGVYRCVDGSSYDGEWHDDKWNGRGRLIYANGTVYEGEFADNQKNGIGKCTYSYGTIYEGQWKDDKHHGHGKVYYSDECGFMEGEYINDLEEGRHTHFACDGKMIKYYYFTNGKIFTFENDINKYIISEQKVDIQNRYITILISLHGSDVINSICKLADNKHVRCISPMKCGQILLNDIESIKDAFQIAYNISHLQHNRNASTHQKMMKTIELYNKSNTDFYDLNEKTYNRPIIDHQYTIENNSNGFDISKIYIIDTNFYTPELYKDNMFDVINENLNELKKMNDSEINQFDILPILIEYLSIYVENDDNFFLRSNLINVLLDLGYDTINIIELSCRIINEEIFTDDYNQTIGKNYQCQYMINKDESTYLGDAVTSIRK